MDGSCVAHVCRLLLFGHNSVGGFGLDESFLARCRSLDDLCDLYARLRSPIALWTSDAERAERFQRELFKPFFKAVLPASRKDERNPDLRFIDRIATNNVAIELDNFMQSTHQTAVLLGLSGCGKSYELVQFARKHWCVFIDATPSGANRIVDNNIQNLLYASSAIARAVGDKWTVALTHCQNDILGRLVTFYYATKSIPDLTPSKWLDIQLSDSGQMVVGRFTDWIGAMSPRLRDQIVEDIRQAVGRRLEAFIIDEAGYMRDHLKTELVSSQASGEGRCVPREHQRGMLGLYTEAVNRTLGCKVIMAGTNVRLGDRAILCSSRGKEGVRPVHVTGFRPWTEDEQLQLLDSLIDLNGVDTRTWVSRMGRARPRWCDFFVRRLCNQVISSGSAGMPKQQMFDTSASESIAYLKGGMELGHCVQLAVDSCHDLLVRLYVASTLSLDAWLEADVEKAEIMAESLCYVDEAAHPTQKNMYHLSIAEVN